MITHNIDPGMLDRRLGILTPTGTVGTTGGVSETLTLTTTVFAKIEYPSVGQKEAMMAAKETAVRRIVATIRYYPGLNEMNALRLDSEDYDIVSISEVGRKAYHVIEAERRL